MLLIFCFAFFYSIYSIDGKDSHLEAVFWEVKPFIFINKNNAVDGIIPKMFAKGQYYCGKHLNNTDLLSFMHQEPSRKSFYNLLRSDTPYGENELSKIQKGKAFWGPILAYEEKDDKLYETERGLLSFQLMKSKSIAVIVPRYLVALPNKILRGILSCQQIIIIALLLSVLFGIIIWMVERFYNDEFPNSFIKGAGTGVWWSLVSMTTVGYGDVVPRSLPGRIIALIWVFIGVMIACVMTATTTEIVTGVEDLTLIGQKVAVLENSLEAKIAAEDYRVNAIPARSYEEVFDFVRQGKVFAAMINADVAAWYQEEIHDDSASVPLRVIKKLPANININCLIASKPSLAVRKTFQCMLMQKDEVYIRSIEHYQRYCMTETLYIDSLGDLFRNNLFIQVLLGCILALICIGILFEICSNKLVTVKESCFSGSSDNTVRLKGVDAIQLCRCSSV